MRITSSKHALGSTSSRCAKGLVYARSTSSMPAAARTAQVGASRGQEQAAGSALHTVGTQQQRAQARSRELRGAAQRAPARVFTLRGLPERRSAWMWSDRLAKEPDEGVTSRLSWLVSSCARRCGGTCCWHALIKQGGACGRRPSRSLQQAVGGVACVATQASSCGSRYAMRSCEARKYWHSTTCQETGRTTFEQTHAHACTRTHAHTPLPAPPSASCSRS